MCRQSQSPALADAGLCDALGGWLGWARLGGGAGLDLDGPGWRITRCSPGAQQEQQQSSTKHWFAPVEPLDLPGGRRRAGAQ